MGGYRCVLVWFMVRVGSFIVVEGGDCPHWRGVMGVSWMVQGNERALGVAEAVQVQKQHDTNGDTAMECWKAS